MGTQRIWGALIGRPASSPTRPAVSRRETPGPGRRGAGRGGRAGVRGSPRPKARIGGGCGLRARAGGRREASAAPATAATPLRPAADQAAGSPRPRRHTHPSPRPGPGGLPALPPAEAARPAPEIYLLIFWAKARRSAMAAKAAAAAVWARTGGRVPPRSRSLPRGLRQSQLRTGEAGAGGRRAGNEPCRNAPERRAARNRSSPSASMPAGARASERSCGRLEPEGRMGRGGSDTPVPAASLLRGPHDRENTQSSQRGASDLVRQEKKITERVGGAWFSRKGRRGNGRWVLPRGAVLCRPGWLGSCSSAPISEQLKALSVLLRPCEWGLTRERTVFLVEKEPKKIFLLQR